MSVVSKLMAAISNITKPALQSEHHDGSTGSTLISEGHLHLEGRTMELSEFVLMSVARTEGLPVSHHQGLANIILSGWNERTPYRPLAKLVQECHPFSREAALEFVSLHMGRISAMVSREQALATGLTKFRWRSSGALDEIAGHEARDGLILEWAQPKIAGEALDTFQLPGMEPGCKCRAQAVLDFEAD